MVVEDDLDLRGVAAGYLRNRHFTVVEAASAEEALRILASDRFVRAVFADVRLAGAGSGVALTHLIRSDCPEVKVLLTSGMPSLDDPPSGVPFLPKPYRLAEVERQLLNLLSAADTDYG